MERQLCETKAGQTLYTALEIIVNKQQQTLKKIRAQSKEHADEKALNALRTEYEALRKQLIITVQEMQTLKLPLGKRLLHIVRSPLDFIRHSEFNYCLAVCINFDCCED
jgi:cell division FtsZ-interacting protein ZapD